MNRKLLALTLTVLTIMVAAFWAGAQTGPVAALGSKDQDLNISAGLFHSEGTTSQVGYWDQHVVVTSGRSQLRCEHLIVRCPGEKVLDNHPTNIVAEVKVDVELVDKDGVTNHTVSNHSLYVYQLIDGVTNETIKFTGNSTNFSKNGVVVGDPLIYDFQKGAFFVANPVMTIKIHENDTNGSPFNIK
jgi:lipopolysaccharide export system protein LptA